MAVNTVDQAVISQGLIAAAREMGVAAEARATAMLDAPGDLAARWRQAEMPLLRFLGRVPMFTQIARHVAAPLEPMPVADALVGRVASWLPAPTRTPPRRPSGRPP